MSCFIIMFKEFRTSRSLPENNRGKFCIVKFFDIDMASWDFALIYLVTISYLSHEKIFREYETLFKRNATSFPTQEKRVHFATSVVQELCFVHSYMYIRNVLVPKLINFHLQISLLNLKLIFTWKILIYYNNTIFHSSLFTNCL